LIDVLTPPVREVKIGSGENSLRLGGEEVMYRHELRFFNPTGLFIDVSDSMSDEEINKRIDFVKDFEIERIGKKLRLDGVAIRSASDDPEKFRGVVGRVAKDFPGALILCSFNPDVLSAGMEVVGDRKPLLYAANEGNWERVLGIAQKYDAPLAVYSPDLGKLGTLVRELSSRDFNRIILDPGIESDAGLSNTLNRFVMLRKSAMKGVKELGYPLMASTLAVWMNSGDEMNSAYRESTIAGVLMDRFASLLITHSIDMWSILPTVTLRQNIYTDPRVEPTVEAKLYELGSPDENSPLFITTNFALTYFNVSGDLESDKISCYLLVIDTEGLGVTVSVAAEKLTASGIKDALDKTSAREKIKHSKLIIPGAAARIKGVIEDATEMEIIVGPQDSSQISSFLKENW
ncbi:MAG: acetyl-CoA decarbonylase/synthase complex subunit gamma, partial [Candidatus Altiarchaeota archaeon]|nr:acetyl-CoA decarbonylase/synthase complex subunit gamma [Candidatus Altiarchaeota archaeon]